MANTSSYFPIRMLDRNAPDGILFGPSNFKNEADWLYPDRILKLNSTIIWCPEQKKTIGIGSYADAVKSNDEEALKKLDELGIPRNLLPKFGFTVSDDFSSTYTLKKSKAPRKPKKPSVTILQLSSKAHLMMAMVTSTLVTSSRFTCELSLSVTSMESRSSGISTSSRLLKSLRLTGKSMLQVKFPEHCALVMMCYIKNRDEKGF